MKLSLKRILIWGAGLFAFIAFLFMFGNQLKSVYGSTRTYASAKDVLFNSDYSAWLSTVGYFLILLAGGIAVAVSFLVKDEKVQKIVLLVCAGVLFVAAIMVFAVKGNYKASMINEAMKEARKYDMDLKRSEVRAEMNEMFANIKVTGCPVFAGIFALMGAAMIAVPMFVKLPDPFAKKGEEPKAE